MWPSAPARPSVYLSKKRHLRVIIYGTYNPLGLRDAFMVFIVPTRQLLIVKWCHLNRPRPPVDPVHFSSVYDTKKIVVAGIPDNSAAPPFDVPLVDASQITDVGICLLSGSELTNHLKWTLSEKCVLIGFVPINIRSAQLVLNVILFVGGAAGRVPPRKPYVVHTATAFSNCSMVVISSPHHSGRFARTRAAAKGGGTAFPHRATCLVLPYSLPV